MIAIDLVGMVSRGAARSSAELRPPSITYHYRLTRGGGDRATTKQQQQLLLLPGTEHSAIQLTLSVAMFTKMLHGVSVSGRI